LCGPEPAVRIAEAVRGGVDWVQVRVRDLEGAPLLRFADGIATGAREAAAEAKRRVRILVNRRLDIALAIGADGVHLGFDAMEVATARRVLRAGALVGVSTHSADDVRAAAGADYVHLAPIFAPISKRSSRPPLGCEAIAEAVLSGIPVIAQGGVDASHAAALRAAGAAGVAVTGAILSAPDPGKAAAEIKRALGSRDQSTI